MTCDLSQGCSWRRLKFLVRIVRIFSISSRVRIFTLSRPCAGLFPELAGPFRMQTAKALTWGTAYTLDPADLAQIMLLYPTVNIRATAS